MFAHTLRVTPELVNFVLIDEIRRSAFADVPGLESAMMDSITRELIGAHDSCEDGDQLGSSNFADDGLDFLNEKAKRRAAYQRENGRFGGYERSRRVRSNGDAQWDRFERKAVRQAIEDGLIEYYSGEFSNDDGSRKRRGHRGGAHRSHRALPPVVTARGADHVVENSRTGHLVAVAVKPTALSPREQRKRAMASSRPCIRLSTADVRRRMGLLDS